MTTTGPDSTDDARAEAASLRQRLSLLSAASRRINESLDLDEVLQGVLDSARLLAGARYGVLAVLDDAGQVEALLASGLSPEEFRGLQEIPGRDGISQHLIQLPGPLRVADFAAHAQGAGLPEFLPPVPVRALLGVPIRRMGRAVGQIYVARSEPGEAFSAEDEETLVTFAAQAALVIANARRHREERLARAGLETLVDTSPVGVVVFDVRTGTPTSFNREALRIVDRLGNPGQSPAELLNSLTMRRDDGREAVLADLPLARMMSAGETVRAEEMTLVAPDGRSVCALVNASPVRAEPDDMDEQQAGDSGAGEVETYVATLQDLSELEELSRLRAEFLGLVSHELRTPLAAVRGSVTTLLESGAELELAEAEQFHRIIRDQSERMRLLISDLLDVARIQTGGLAVSPAPKEVGELLEDARKRFRNRGSRSRLNVEIELADGLPPVLADGWRLAQALAHLLAHVAARLPLGAPQIRVEAAREGLYVAVTVAAEGRDGRRMASRLGRLAEVERSEQSGDAGMGLSICQGIVEAHGGRLRSLGEAQQDRLRVLAVVDDPQALRFMREALWNEGYFPIIGGNPEDIPRLVREERPQMALLDASLSGYEGLLPNLVRGILDEGDAPVILLAAPGQEAAMVQALDLGVSDYLVKPFSAAELAARVRGALRSHDAPHLGAASEHYVLEQLSIDFSQRRVSMAGSDVRLTPNEYALLAELALNAGRMIAHDQLLQRVWSPGRRGQRWLLREVIKRLRIKLGDNANDPTYIFTIPRAGYRLGPEAPEPE